jgi:hypothetical protein
MPKELQIVHICEDEKFINSAVEQFEHCFPRQNTFFVLPVSSDENFKHVSAWQFNEVGNWTLNKEDLVYENIKIAQRSYK